MTSWQGDHRSGLTEQKLLHGWSIGAPRVKIRLATAADVPAVEQLLPAAEVDLTGEMADAVRDGTMGRAHRAALAARGAEHGSPAFTRALAEAFAKRGLGHPYIVTALMLVAEHRDHGVIGTVLAGPPPNVAEQCVAHIERNGGTDRDSQKLVMLGAMAVTKVAALSVAEPARGRGVGGALLSRVKRIYFHHNYAYVYGQMPDRAGLPGFYRRQGFEVKQPGEGLDLWVVFGMHIVVHSGPGHRIFVRTQMRGGPDPN